jgi:ribosomal protein S18 acetylase RimI-like enzyme
MTKNDISVRHATRADVQPLAQLVEFASEGLALCLWTQLAGPGGDPWDIGRKRVAAETGGISYRHALIAELAGKPAGAMISYALGAEADPIHDAVPAMLVPLHRLMSMAPDTWYVHALAAYPQHRGGGIGTVLLAEADRRAARANRPRLSLIVSDTNTHARRLYEHCGYREAARGAMVKERWDHPGTNWLLMTKRL